METGYSTTGDGYKQNWKQSLSIYIKGSKCFQMALWICHEYTYDGCNDHEDQQVTVQVVTRLQQTPYRSYRCDQDVDEDDHMPGSSRQKHREVHAQCYCSDQHYDCDCCVHPFVKFSVTKDHTKTYSFNDKYHRSCCYCSVCHDLGYGSVICG